MAGLTIAPEAPRVRLNPVRPGVSGQTISVARGGDLQAAINTSNAGDVVALIGGDYIGNYVARNGLYLRGSNGARLVSPNSDPAFKVPAGTKQVYVDSVSFTAQPGAALGAVCWFIVLIDPSGATSPDGLASDITFDECKIAGQPLLRTLSGLRADGNSVSFINGSITEIHWDGFDSQAFSVTTGAGPFLIRNSRLEGAGENVMFGGADPMFSGLVPSDIELDRVTLFKPLSWKVDDPSYAGVAWTVKNLFELKNARRVHMHGCQLENCWQHAQTGFGILLTPRNQGGFAPWSTVEDVLIENCTMINSQSGITLQSADETKSAGSRRLALRNLLIKGGYWTGMNIASGPEDLEIDHATIITNDYMAWSGANGPRTTVKNSIFGYGSFGGDVMFVQGAETHHNAFVLFPGDKGDGLGNVRVVAPYYGDPAGVWAGFKAYATPEAAGIDRDGILSAASPLKGAASDGKNIGVDFVKLAADQAPPAPPQPPQPPQPPVPTLTLEQRVATLEAWRAAIKAAS